MLKVRYDELRAVREALKDKEGDVAVVKKSADDEYERASNLRKSAVWGGELSDHYSDDVPSDAGVPVAHASTDAKTSEEKGISFKGVPKFDI